MLYEYDATVLAVHDGDTVTCDVDLGFKTWLRGVKFRLYGINAPELSTDRGPAALGALAGQIPPDGRVTLLTMPSNVTPLSPDKVEKFGRWLATVIVTKPDGTRLNLNKWMVDNGHAVPFMVGNQ